MKISTDPNEVDVGVKKSDSCSQGSKSGGKKVTNDNVAPGDPPGKTSERSAEELNSIQAPYSGGKYRFNISM